VNVRLSECVTKNGTRIALGFPSIVKSLNHPITQLLITKMQEDLFKRIVSHSKEYGFIYPSSEVYDGLNGVYDYGPMGVELKNNIKEYW